MGNSNGMLESTRNKTATLVRSYMLANGLNPKQWKWCTVTFDEGAELGWRTVFVRLYPSKEMAEQDATRYNSTRMHNECGWACALTVKALGSLNDKLFVRSGH